LRWSLQSPEYRGIGGSCWKAAIRVLIAEEKRTAAVSILAISIEPYIAAMCIGAIAWHLVARYAVHASASASKWPLIFAIVIGGIPLTLNLARNLVHGQFGSDLLAGISIVTSLILDEYLAGCVIVLMLSGGAALEQFATRRASSVLSALAERMPQTAHRKTPSGAEDISLGEVRIGDLLEVFPHESCPVDGSVFDGQGTMDESYLTGEPYVISKVPGASVLSGAINGETALTIRAEKLPADSRYAKIVRVMEQAELNRPRFRRIGDRLGAWYTVVALLIAVASWVASRDPTRFLSVLVIATPCPLLLAIPVAIIGAISLAASRAIIVKDPAMLERVHSCRTIIFDKTGTLTYGKPALTEVLCAPGVNRNTALRIAASLEQYSKHPLASGIREAARRESITPEPVSEISEKPGQGLTGEVEQMQVQITRRGQLLKIRPELAPSLPPVAAGMESILIVNGEYGATFRFRDVPRKESRSLIGHLAPRHAVERVMLLSGDRESEVRYLAHQVGITEALSGKSPEEKVAIVRQEAERAPTMFLGDGINDAPAMQAATVGIAFGQNSDITAEAADAVILETSLRKVDELIHIGRRMKRIALESAVGGMALSVFGMLVAAAGYLPPVAGAVTQELIDVVAVLNAVRVALPGKDLRSDES
jgi:heavy metal translocating P-type ATPase